MTGAATAWGWTAHLKDGGTTPWTEWSAPAEPQGRAVPGAQQLELLRRVNLVGRPSAALADAVLTVDPPRRTRPALPLEGGPAVPDHGPRPVDPAELGDNDLTRLAAVLLARDLATRSVREPRRGWRRPWRIRYHLLGDPEHAAPLRRHLTARGRPPGGYGGRVLVLGTDTSRMLVDLWTAHCFRNGAVRWRDWIGLWADRDTLPAPLDLPSLARREIDRPVPNRVHVVTDPALAPRLLGVRRGPESPQPLAASALDLGRRVSAELRPLARPQRRARLLTDVLRPRLAHEPGLPLVVPEEHRAWVAGEADRLHQQLLRARYPVHGDPALVLPVDRAGIEAPVVSDTFALAMRLLLETELQRREEGP
jgi:hypothetical protein